MTKFYKEFEKWILKHSGHPGTEYDVIRKPSVNKEALRLSGWEAIDITYKCPKCGDPRAVTWIYPDENMIYPDTCCGETVVFRPKIMEEE